MRIRTGRFDGLRLAGKRWDSQPVEESVRQRPVERHRRVAPPAAVVAGNLPGRVRGYSASDQLAVDNRASLPVLELHGPQPMADPTVGASTRKRGPCGFTAPAVCALGLGSDFCGMASPRYVAVSPSPSFDPSPLLRLIWPLLTSRSVGLLDHRHPFRRKARSPRVRTSSFAARPPDLRCLALVTRASRSVARLPCSAPPSIRFLFVGPQLRFPLPSRRPHGTTLCGSLRSL